MNPIAGLALAWAKQHRARTLLTAGALALATSLVVFTVDGYRSAIDRTTGLARQTLGAIDVVITPRYAIDPVIAAALDSTLAADPTVERVVRAEVHPVDIADDEDTTYYDAWRADLIALPVAEPPIELAAGRWYDPHSSAAEGVISGGLARRWGKEVGDVLHSSTPAGLFDITVIGITDEIIAHPTASGVFVAPPALHDLVGGARTADRVLVDLATDDGADTWIAAQREALEGLEPPVEWRDLQTVAAELGQDQTIKRLRSMGSAAAAIAMLAAAFIVYAALSAGAVERVRQLAVLRTIGATRGQVAGLVLGEGLALGAIGLAIGLPLGWLWLQTLALLKPELFGGPIAPGSAAVIAAVATTGVACLLAGALPAWAATRTRPVEVLAGAPPSVPSARRSLIRIMLGAGSLILAIGLVIAPVDPGLAGAGAGGALLALALAGLLLLPAVIRGADLLLAMPVARLLHLPPALLRDQLRARSGRVAGTVLTLALCLGLSVMMNVWGRTMVLPFLPSPRLPDVVVSILPAGVPPEAADAVADLPQVEPDGVLPMAVEQTLLGPAHLAMVDYRVDDAWVLMVGVEPERALLGADPLLPLEVEGGSLAEVAAALAEPGTCVIPPTFAEAFGLAIGDRLTLLEPGDSRGRVELEIVGLGSMPGWHWVTKLSRMRSMGAKPQAPVLMNRATAEAGGIERIRHWYVDVVPDYDRGQLRSGLTRLAEAHAGAYTNPQYGPAIASGVTVKATETMDVRERFQTRADQTIWILGALPLSALLVAVLGVANAIAAGIRARSREFGILRAVGMEGRAAGRLVLGEALLMAAAAAILAVPLAILAAWAGIAVSLQAFNTGGSAPGLVIPWLDIVIAIAITAAAAVIAALASARRLARREPLDMLGTEA